MTKEQKATKELEELLAEREDFLEAENYHALNGIYRRIAESVTQVAGVSAALEVMYRLGNLIN